MNKDLKRVTFSTETLEEFISLSHAKQRILTFLLSNRSMLDRPARPTRYFSYQDIADETGLKATTVRVLIVSLVSDCSALTGGEFD